MRCKTCEYRLWNLTSRQCPECGTPFRASEYEFVPNSVQYCCPHCGQAYYGTSAKGHLVPIEFDCVACQRHIHMDEMVLLPTAGVEEEQTGAERMPWLERKKIGGLRAWLATVGKALVAPGRLMKSVPEQSSIGQALWFAVLTQFLVMLVFAAPFLVLTLGFVAAGAGGASGGGMAARMGFVYAVLALGGFVPMLIFMAAWILTVHVLLKITGTTAGGVRRTAQAICYSSGANVLTAVPCIGVYFGWIWWVISAVMMVKERQKVRGARAALTVLVFPALLLAGVIGLYAWAITTSMRTAATLASMPASAFAATGEPAQVQRVLDGLLNYARAHNGRGPAHAIELAAGDGATLTPLDFVAAQTGTSTAKVPVAGMTLDQFMALERYEERAAVQKAADSLPPGTSAYRLGDYVFTDPGMDLAHAAPPLWVVILSPDPDSNPTRSINGWMIVGQANGTTQTLSAQMFPISLAAQNAIRAQHGLTALPDPATIAHGRPATAQK